MRICPHCQYEMSESFDIKIDSSGNGLKVTKKRYIWRNDRKAKGCGLPKMWRSLNLFR